MNLRSELVLNDAERAIELHKDSLEAEEFRISWFSVVCLLRAVGHVLDKVDGNQSPNLRMIIDAKFNDLKRTKPKPEIYWQFIDFERNRFLKEYEHSIDRGIIMGPVDIVEDKEIFIAVDQGRSTNIHTGDHSGQSYSRIASGFYRGRSEKEVALEALSWWKDYIKEIKIQLDN